MPSYKSKPRKTARRVRSIKRSRSSQAGGIAVLQRFRWERIKAYWLSRQGAIMAAKIFGAGVLAVLLIFAFYAKDLPSPGKINARVSAQTTKFYDRTGNTLLYEVYGDKNRSIVTFDQMPDNAKKATIAIEDKNFYKHGAFSALGILRAAFVDVVAGGKFQGGSTITQQYVKNALLDPTDHTFGRKIKELIVSVEIEQLYKKDDILKLYLNEIPYGNQAYGIDAAVKTYFPYHKSSKELTLDEAAMLATIPQLPTYYSPYGSHTDALINRRNLVLDAMADQHYATNAEVAAAKKVNTLAKIPARPNLYANIQAPHFVLWLQEQLEAKYGTTVVTEGGLKIVTTIDLEKQKLAEKAILDNRKTVLNADGHNASLVSGDPKTGQVYAMVGSYDFSDPEFGAYNVATSGRQPGSSFKPIVYATAWKKNYGPGTTIYDVPTDFGGGYKPQNYSRSNYGVQSMRSALAGSLNIPAVKTFYMAGIEESLQTARDLGITTLNKGADNYGLTLVLGTGDVQLNQMVNAYETFANGGIHHDLTGVLKITDPKGKVLEQYKDGNPKRALDPQIAYLMSSVLSDNSARAYIFGNNNPLTLPGRPVAAKTGTTTDYKDAWTMGYTPSLTTGVWVGNNDNKPMNSGGVNIAAPIWNQYMRTALQDTPVEQFQRPDGIKEITLDANTGRLPTDGSKQKRTDIFPSWYKPQSATADHTGKVDKVSGKLATDCTPPEAVETVSIGAIHAEIPSSDAAYSRWEPPVAALAARLGFSSGGALPTENDNIHNCSDVRPTVNLTVNNLGSGNYHLSANVTSGTHLANKLDLYFDDILISSQAINGNATVAADYSAPSNGNHTFKAVVTDAALYKGEDQSPVSVTGAGGGGGGGGGFVGFTPADNSSQSAGVVSFSWAIHPGAAKYRLTLKKNGVGTIYTSPPSPATTTVSSPLTTGTYTWYVEALDGDGGTTATTSTYKFTI